MPLQQTTGNVTTDAYGGGIPVIPNYIENVFSTYLVTGSTSSKTISNGIDLSTKGGMVWTKWRSSTSSHFLYDTARGATNYISSNATTTQTTLANSLTAFNTDGFTLGSEYDSTTANSYATWTFRKQPKFFDVVTWTGNDSTNRQISHSLNSIPGCIIVKNLNDATYWAVYHTSLGATKGIYLNYTGGADTSPSLWNDTEPTSTQFTVGNASNVNASPNQYVAYIFASNAGGFGLNGTDNVITCGSFTTDSSGNATIDLGYEPQWVMIKQTNTGGQNWIMQDNMRGFVASGNNGTYLSANTTAANTLSGGPLLLTSTGFKANAYVTSSTIIYIAIRRGPMKVPTSGTSVFQPVAYTGNSNVSTTTTNTLTNGFAADMAFYKARDDAGPNWGLVDKLRGQTVYLAQNVNAAEATQTSPQSILFNNTQSILMGYASADFNFNYYVNTFVQHAFQRAPSFFDEVCYTGTGTLTRYITHNLSVTPQLAIVKRRSSTGNWVVCCLPSGGSGSFLRINSTSASDAATMGANGFVNLSSSSTSDFYVQAYDTSVTDVNTSSATYVAYLFASCPGVSKVGSYTGTGATQTISCGFTGGARFVLIKRTDNTGSWFVWDTARGMVSGTDPRLLLNATNTESNADWVYTTTGGFQIVTTDASINASGGDYIFLAIA